MPTLFDPITMGDLKLPNRIIMAPLSRTRATAQGRVPNAMMAEYYAQRASAGMILSEATSVSAMGVGYEYTPGIWSDEQIEAWKLVTRAVHDAGGQILLQLWHVGRISHPLFLDGKLPLAPSAIKPDGRLMLYRPETDYVAPRAVDRSEIPGLVEEFRQGAINAMKAGFDGVEIHGGNGYLIDQFLQDSTNARQDDYGGSVENRARFMLEIVDAAISIWGKGRVGAHIAPRGDMAAGDSNPLAIFSHLAGELGRRDIAFLFAREYIGEGRIGPELKKAFGGPYIANERFDFESGQAVLAKGEADAVAYGLLFIANPDLPARFAAGAKLNELRPDNLYHGGPVGYTDYPALVDA